MALSDIVTCRCRSSVENGGAAFRAGQVAGALVASFIVTWLMRCWIGKTAPRVLVSGAGSAALIVLVGGMLWYISGDQPEPISGIIWWLVGVSFWTVVFGLHAWSRTRPADVVAGGPPSPARGPKADTASEDTQAPLPPSPAYPACPGCGRVVHDQDAVHCVACGGSLAR